MSMAPASAASSTRHTAGSRPSRRRRCPVAASSRSGSRSRPLRMKWADHPTAGGMLPSSSQPATLMAWLCSEQDSLGGRSSRSRKKLVGRQDRTMGFEQKVAGVAGPRASNYVLMAMGQCYLMGVVRSVCAIAERVTAFFSCVPPRVP
jgi:hypothetical protein